MGKVLIVDDIQTEMHLMRNALQPLGYQILEASDGSQGYTIAKAEKPDIILLDVVMPGQDGFATCRKLKKDPVTKDIPVVMVTSKERVSALRAETTNRTVASDRGMPASPCPRSGRGSQGAALSRRPGDVNTQPRQRSCMGWVVW